MLVYYNLLKKYRNMLTLGFSLGIRNTEKKWALALTLCRFHMILSILLNKFKHMG
jgi:hypothetical protein